MVIALSPRGHELDDVADGSRPRVVAREEREVLRDGEAVVERRGLSTTPIRSRHSRPPRPDPLRARHGAAVTLAVALEDLDRRRLAAPFGPSSPKISPRAISKLTPRSASRPVVGLLQGVDGNRTRHIWPI
jgi:hypothetical protein